MTLLTIEGLTIHAFGRTLFDDFALDVNAGETVLLVGPNGSGKSTLLDVIAGVRPALRGRIVVGGVDARKDPRRASAKLGYGADRPELPRDVRVDEWLALVASVRGARAVAPDELPFGVGDLRGQPLGCLSLGETRRVLLAAALIGEPELLLLDEPTNGLDAARREELDARIEERRARRAGAGAGAVVIATHDRRTIARHGGRDRGGRGGRVVSLERADEASESRGAARRSTKVTEGVDTHENGR